MNLSKYCDNKENLWNEIEGNKVKKLIEYINQNIDEDLYKIANTNDSMEVFNKLKLWLFNFYKEQLLNGLKYVGVDYERFKKGLIYSLILGVTRNRDNNNLIYNILKSSNIIL